MQEALQQNCRSQRVLFKGGAGRLDEELHVSGVAVPVPEAQEPPVLRVIVVGDAVELA